MCLGLRSTLIRVAIIIPDIKTLFPSLKTLNSPSEYKPRGPWPLSPAAQALIREAATCRPHTPAPRRMRLKPRGALAPRRGLRPRGAWATNWAKSVSLFCNSSAFQTQISDSFQQQKQQFQKYQMQANNSERYLYLTPLNSINNLLTNNQNDH